MDSVNMRNMDQMAVVKTFLNELNMRIDYANALVKVMLDEICPIKKAELLEKYNRNETIKNQMVTLISQNLVTMIEQCYSPLDYSILNNE